MNFFPKPALNYTWDELAQLMTNSFAEYFVTIQMTPSSLAGMCVSEGIDLRYSRVALREEEPAVPIIVPEGLATGLFAELGFQRETLTQFEMRLEL